MLPFDCSNSGKQRISYSGNRYGYVEFTGPTYHFDKSIYENRVFDSKGVADTNQEIQFGPNIKDWPQMVELPENLIIKVVSEIHDPVTTTDELIPSGETSSYRSNPLGLAEFALSRKDPAYVGRAKEVQKQKRQEKQENVWEKHSQNSVISCIKLKKHMKFQKKMLV